MEERTRKRLTESQLASPFLTQNQENIAEAYYRLGKVYYDKGDLAEAEDFFVNALNQCAVDKTPLKLKLCGFLIRLYAEKQDHAKTQEFIQRSQKAVEEKLAAEGSLSAESYFQLGSIKSYQNNPKAARADLLKAYEMAKPEKNSEVLSKVLYALAINAFYLKDLDQSEKYLEELMVLLQVIKKHYLQGNMFVLLGNIHVERQKYEEAIANYRAAIRFLRKKHCWNLYGYTLLYQGLAYKKMERFGEALTCFEQAKDIVDENSFRRLASLIKEQVQDVNDSNVDLHFDRHHRIIYEKDMGKIDFKHRFVLLEILFLLARHAGSFHDKEQLARQIWKNEYNPLIHDKLIYTSISRLRKLIEPKSGKRKYILREKDGYTFNPNAKIRFYNENDNKTQQYQGYMDLGSPV